MPNPYTDQPDHQFWRKTVAGREAEAVDPVTQIRFTIPRTARIATSGSCFAQHIARTLKARGFDYMVTEPGPQTEGARDENYGVFPARFGNVYTARQLLQLFQRAYGLFEPEIGVWRLPDGGFVDPFRPRVQSGGFATEAALLDDREAHFASTRRMFEDCDVLVFTLGLTEAWQCSSDGAIVPLAPGVAGGDDQLGRYGFVNFSASEVVGDLIRFLEAFRVVNRSAKILLTVSPVPLVATYEDRHVLVSTIYSKSVLRVAAEEVIRANPDVDYFPSYEMITGPQARKEFYSEDRREVTDAGVDYVMSVFARHYLTDRPGLASAVRPAHSTAVPPLGGRGPFDPVRPRPRATESRMSELKELAAIVCDEEALDEAR